MSRKEGPQRLPGHLPGLDGVRGVAILAVMALHFVGDATPRSLMERVAVKLASYGLLGVDLFFVLSGFLITGLLIEAKGKPHFFRNFYARRTLRIFPLYYFVLGVLFLALPAFIELPASLEQARREQVWLWTYTSNFYLAAQADWTLGYVSHFWSLAIEEHFYLAWPLVVFSLRRQALERACLGVIAGGLVLRMALAASGVSEMSISVLTPCRVDTLCVGALLAAIARREDGPAPLFRWAPRAALGTGLAVLVLSAWCALTQQGLPLLHQVRNTLYALFFGALTVVAVLPARGPLQRLFLSPVLRFFGKYSYGLYVYHGILNWRMHELGLQPRLEASLGSHGAAFVGNAVVGTTCSVVLAFASYQLFEKRFLALKRHFEAAQ